MLSLPHATGSSFPLATTELLNRVHGGISVPLGMVLLWGIHSSLSVSRPWPPIWWLSSLILTLIGWGAPLLIPNAHPWVEPLFPAALGLQALGWVFGSKVAGPRRILLGTSAVVLFSAMWVDVSRSSHLPTMAVPLPDSSILIGSFLPIFLLSGDGVLEAYDRRSIGAGLTSLIAVCTVGIPALGWRLMSNSVDVHLSDTLFVPALQHAIALLWLPGWLASFSRGGGMRAWGAAAGMLGLIAGFALLITAHGALGIQGMPQRMSGHEGFGDGWFVVACCGGVVALLSAGGVAAAEWILPLRNRR